jgi:D-alanyl-D-alanine carboxypeptidase
VNTFYRALLGGKLLPSEQLQEMMTTVMGDNGRPYGLGLAAEELSCGVAWGHQGNFPGYLVLSYSSPDGQHQATGAFNLDPNSMAPESQEAVGQLMDHAFCGVKP